MIAADPYVYPDTNVLKNSAGVRDPEVLAEFERRVTTIRADQLAADRIGGRYDLEHFRAIHQHIFKDVYPWAGELRTVDIGKGDTSFAPIRTPRHNLESWGRALFDDLRQDKLLQGLDRERFVDKLAYHTSELNYWHPFREGNGRTTREFIRQLSQQAGYHVDYTKIEPHEWNLAATKSHETTGPWRDLFSRATTSLRARSFERDSRQEALQSHPELKGSYAALDRANAAAERFPQGQARDQFVAEQRQQITAILKAGRVIDDTAKQASRTPLSKPSRDLDR